MGILLLIGLIFGYVTMINKIRLWFIMNDISKHTVTYINEYNELVLFTNSILGNDFLESLFWDFTTNISPHADTKKEV